MQHVSSNRLEAMRPLQKRNLRGHAGRAHTGAKRYGGRLEAPDFDPSWGGTIDFFNERLR